MSGLTDLSFSLPFFLSKSALIDHLDLGIRMVRSRGQFGGVCIILFDFVAVLIASQLGGFVMFWTIYRSVPSGFWNSEAGLTRDVASAVIYCTFCHSHEKYQIC